MIAGDRVRNTTSDEYPFGTVTNVRVHPFLRGNLQYIIRWDDGEEDAHFDVELAKLSPLEELAQEAE